MTQAPATGLWGPGDYEPDFETIDELWLRVLSTEIEAPMIDEFKCWERSAAVTALLDLAHDLDARANGQWEIVEGREIREARWHAPTEFSMNRPIRWERMQAGKRPDIYDFGDTIAVWVNEGDFIMASLCGVAISPAKPFPAYTADADLVTGPKPQARFKMKGYPSIYDEGPVADLSGPEEADLVTGGE